MKKNKRGFSLVELIVVIAIIGILAAIAVPKYSEYRKNAKLKSDYATAKLIADAAVQYMAINGVDSLAEVDLSATTGTASKIKSYISTEDVEPKSEGYDKFLVKYIDGQANVWMEDDVEGDGSLDDVDLYPAK